MKNVIAEFPSKRNRTNKGSAKRRTPKGQVKELLARIVKSGNQEAFTLRGICPRDASLLETGFDWLLDYEFVERVPQHCGAWFYRLTMAGRNAAENGVPPKTRFCEK